MTVTDLRHLPPEKPLILNNNNLKYSNRIRIDIDRQTNWIDVNLKAIKKKKWLLADNHNLIKMHHALVFQTDLIRISNMLKLESK